MRSGVKAAIVGPPNVGKSSILNYLAGRKAAIVSAIPGTTRDAIEVILDVAGYKVRSQSHCHVSILLSNKITSVCYVTCPVLLVSPRSVLSTWMCLYSCSMLWHVQQSFSLHTSFASSLKLISCC